MKTENEIIQSSAATDRWTAAQRLAIENPSESDLLISASAGSGKTSSLVARAIKTVIDNKIPIDRILMLTFSEKAAAELRTRLTSAMLEYAASEGGGSDYIRQQIDDIAGAKICTIDSFCHSLVKEGFELVKDVSPSFGVADEGTAEVLKTKAAEKLLREWDEKGGEAYARVLEIFSLRESDSLISMINKLYSYITVIEERQEWLDKILSDYNKPFEEIGAVKAYVKDVREEALTLERSLHDFVNEVADISTPNFRTNAGITDYIISRFIGAQSVHDLFRALGELDSNPQKRKSISAAEKEQFPQHFQLIDYYEKAKALWGRIAADLSFRDNYEDYVAAHLQNLPIMECLFDMVKDFDRIYTELKRKEALLDFGDIGYYAAKILENQYKRADVKERFSYLFIDECQDTNHIQDTLLNGIAPDNALFMVGDVKQCIYRFRQAEPSLFSDKYDVFKNLGRAIDFKDNFRSHNEILMFVNRIFENVMTKSFGQVDYINEAAFNPNPRKNEKISDYPRVGVYKMLVENEKPETKIGGEVYSVKQDTFRLTRQKGKKEAAKVIELINDLVGKVKFKGKKGEKLVDYGDIAIVTRSRKVLANNVIKALVAAKIPVNACNIAANTRSDEIALLFDFFDVLNNRRQDLPLISVMRSVIGGFTDKELADIKIQAQSKCGFFEAVQIMSERTGELSDKIRAFYSMLDDYSFRGLFTAVPELAQNILDETGWRDSILSRENGQSALAVLNDYIKSLNADVSRSISAFVDYIGKYGEFKASTGVSSAENGVTVMTMHATKGLEFPVVIVIGCGENFVHSTDDYTINKEMGFGLKYYDFASRTSGYNVIFKGIDAKVAEEELEDEMRLLYVAMTRAEEYLFLVGECGKNLGGTVAPNRARCYFDWIEYAASQNKDVLALISECVIDNAPQDKQTAAKEELRFFDSPDENAVSEVKTALNWRYPYEESTKIGIKYSVTAINREEQGEAAPVLFNENENAIKGGIEYHRVLQCIDLTANTPERVTEELNRMAEEGLISDYTHSRIKPSEIAACLNSPLMRYAAANRVMREQKFMLQARASEIMDTEAEDTVLLQGVIDMLILGEQNVVVDFKRTGSTPEELKERYGKQLALYKAGAEKVFGVKIDRTVLYVLGQNLVVEL